MSISTRQDRIDATLRSIVKTVEAATGLTPTVDQIHDAAQEALIVEYGRFPSLREVTDLLLDDPDVAMAYLL